MILDSISEVIFINLVFCNVINLFHNLTANLKTHKPGSKEYKGDSWVANLASNPQEIY